MPYILVENFNAGLDKRRHPVASPPGTLQTLSNAHISRGGEIEKAKIFQTKFALPAGKTFGMATVSGTLWTFGSDPTPAGLPAGVNYQQLQHPDGFAMTAVLDVKVFQSMFHVIAQFSDGAIYPFFNGAIVSAFVNGVVRASMLNLQGVATHLAACVVDPTLTAISAGAMVTLTGAPGVAFAASAATNNVTGGVADQAIAVATPVVAVAAAVDTPATCTVKVTGGTSTPGTNKITSITIDGVDCLVTSKDWTTSNSNTASLIAAQINTTVSSPEYTAVANGDTVTISAAAGTGATMNGKVVAAVVGGNVTLLLTAMGGGITAAAAVAQQSTFTLSGTFEAGDKYAMITDDGLTKRKLFGAGPVAGAQPTQALVHKSRIDSISQSILLQSAIGAPTLYGQLDAGAAEVDMSSRAVGAELLTGLGLYQNNVPIFSQRTIQVWFIDENPASSSQLQVLNNIGTRSPKAIVPFSETDVFFLADTGIRSLKARDASNTATTEDVGTPIDDLVIEDIRTLSSAIIKAAVGNIEPTTGRYWIAIGGKIYVFSYFPHGKIAAWSMYQPGFTVSDFTVIDRSVYARSGDTIYLYGGDDGNTYPTGVTTTVELPFLDGRSVAGFKEFYGFDIVCDGTWDVYMALDPANPATDEKIASVSGTTIWNDVAGAVGFGPVFKLRLVHTGSGYARISKIAVHYKTAPTE